MKHLRKALALLLCLAVCLTLMPAAFAEEPTGDYLVWEDEPAANETRPIITGQPASISVTEGETATFSAITYNQDQTGTYTYTIKHSARERNSITPRTPCATPQI